MAANPHIAGALPPRTQTSTRSMPPALALQPHAAASSHLPRIRVWPASTGDVGRPRQPVLQVIGVAQHAGAQATSERLVHILMLSVAPRRRKLSHAGRLRLRISSSCENAPGWHTSADSASSGCPDLAVQRIALSTFSTRTQGPLHRLRCCRPCLRGVVAGLVVQVAALPQVRKLTNSFSSGYSWMSSGPAAGGISCRTS